MRTCNFSAGISMQEVFSRILLPGSILGRILEQIFFPWWDPGEYRCLGRILAEMRSGNFSQQGSHWENRPPGQNPGQGQESWHQDPATYFTRVGSCLLGK